MAILRNIDSIDFGLLMSGKICWDEISRIKRVVRRDAVKLPVFMRDMSAYVKSLRKMAELNNLGDFHIPRKPPSAYLKRLSERQAVGGFGKKPKKVRSSDRLSKKVVKKSKSKDKNLNKKDVVDSISEVESFPVSNRFVNVKESQQRFEEHKKLKTQDEERVIALAETLANQIKSIENRPSIDEEINQCKNLICEHSWSSEEYRDTVFSQASSDAYATDISEESQLKLQAAANNNSVHSAEINEVNTLQSLDKSVIPQSCRDSWPRASISSETFEITGDSLTIQERPWTVGVGMGRVSSPSCPDSNSVSNSQALDLSKNKSKPHTRSVDSVELRRDLRAKSINISLPFQPALESSWGSFEDNNSHTKQFEIPKDPSAASEAISGYEWEGDELEAVKKLAMRAETNGRGLGVMRQRQLLHPSVARLTTRSDLNSKVNQVKGKLRSIQRQVTRLQQGSEVNNNSTAATHRETSLSDFTEDLITSPIFPSNADLSQHPPSLQPLPPSTLRDYPEFDQPPIDLNSTNAYNLLPADIINSPFMQDAITTATCVSMFNKPRRRGPFRSHHHLHHHHQQQPFDLKPIPLYSDQSLAAAKLEATRTGSCIVTSDMGDTLQRPVALHPVKRIIYTPPGPGMQPTMSMEALRRQRLLHGRRQANR